MELCHKMDALRQLPMLASLDNNELEQLANNASLRRTTKYNFVFMPDEPANHLFLLLEGRMKIGTFAQDGREVIKEILHPQKLFGDLALAGESRHSEFGQALHDGAACLCISLASFQALMQQNQRLVFACLQHLSSRLQRVEERLAKLVLKDARERIIDFLVDTAGREGRRVGYETLLRHHLTQQDIANLTGTSRQTVTSVMNDLRKSNLIYFNRRSILIRDIERLA